MATYAFSGGKDAVAGWGDRRLMGFNGTWVTGDKWSFELISPTLGNILVGFGQLGGLTPTCCLNFKNRIYLGQGTQFNFSDNGDPTGWEEQNPGAGFVLFLSNFGSNDSVGAMGIFQGRLVVFGRRSIQIWLVNADPSQFSLSQVLDNIGTNAPLSVQQLGDYDIIFLDPSTGIRSLRAREVSLNAYVDDVGLPIDETIQAIIAGGTDVSSSAAIVDPQTKRYWVYINGTIYVLSRYLSSKITAWTTFVPSVDTLGANLVTGGVYDAPNAVAVTPGQLYFCALGGVHDSSISLGGSATVTTQAGGYIVATGNSATLRGDLGSPCTSIIKLVTTSTFTPTRFINYNQQIYVRDSTGQVYLYGGTNGATYDSCIPTGLLPWLDDKKPTQMKTAHGFDASFAGNWSFYVSMSPGDGTSGLALVLQDGSLITPAEISDSSFDKGAIPVVSQGTHFQIKMVGGRSVNPASVSSVVFKYEPGKKI